MKMCFNCQRLVKLDGVRCPNCRAVLVGDLAVVTGQDEDGSTMREQFRAQNGDAK